MDGRLKSISIGHASMVHGGCPRHRSEGTNCMQHGGADGPRTTQYLHDANPVREPPDRTSSPHVYAWTTMMCAHHHPRASMNHNNANTTLLDPHKCGDLTGLLVIGIWSLLGHRPACSFARSIQSSTLLGTETRLIETTDGRPPEDVPIYRRPPPSATCVRAGWYSDTPLYRVDVFRCP